MPQEETEATVSKHKPDRTGEGQLKKFQYKVLKLCSWSQQEKPREGEGAGWQELGGRKRTAARKENFLFFLATPQVFALYQSQLHWINSDLFLNTNACW